MILSSASFVNWNLTDTCNFACRHCYTRRRAEQNELTASECKDAIKKLAQANIFEVNLGGGESLLRPDVFEILGAMSDHGIMADLSTNGWLVDKDCARSIKRARVSKVYVSLDHVEAQVHDYIRDREGSFDKAIQAIRNLQEEGIPVGISAVVSQKNRASLVDIFEFAKKLGLVEVNLKRFRPFGNGFLNAEEFELGDEQCDQTVSQLAAWKRQYQDSIKITYVYSDFPVPGLTDGCPCGRKSLAIHPNGNLLMCVHGKTILGHILKDDVAQIWRTHPFLVKNRCSHICEATVGKNRTYAANGKLLKQRDIRIPEGMTAYEAASRSLFKPDTADASVSAVSLDGKVYSLNLAGTMVFESITSGEKVGDITKKFKQVFAGREDGKLREDIGAMLERMLETKVVQEAPLTT